MFQTLLWLDSGRGKFCTGVSYPIRRTKTHRVTMSSCLSTHLLRSLETEWDGRAREKGSHGARVRRRAFMDGTVTSKLWQMKKGTPNRGDRQVLAWMLDAGTIQRQELSDLLRNIKGKLARATSWLSCQGGWPSWKGIEAVGEAILAANKNTASTVGPQLLMSGLCPKLSLSQRSND